MSGRGRARRRLDGAIGYSELRTGTKLSGAHQLAIDSTVPAVDTIGSSTYPYREIEYAYTYGRPPADSLASSFLGHLSRGERPGRDPYARTSVVRDAEGAAGLRRGLTGCREGRDSTSRPSRRVRSSCGNSYRKELISMVSVRPGPTPIAEIGAPDISSSAFTYACAFFGRSAKVLAFVMSSDQPGSIS